MLIKNLKTNIKYSVLTYSFDNYELFRPLLEKDPLCEYVYVTDNPDLKDNSGWTIIYEPKLNTMPHDYARRHYVKYHPFDYCNTDYIIYLDGSVGINKSLNTLFNTFYNNKFELGVLIIYQNVFDHLNSYLNWIPDKQYVNSQIKLINDYIKEINYNFNYNTCFNATMCILKKCERIFKLYEMTYDYIEKHNTLMDNIIKSILTDVVYYNQKDKLMPIYSSYLYSDVFTKYKHYTNIPADDYKNMKKIKSLYIFNEPVETLFY